MLPGYMDVVRDMGGVPIVLPLVVEEEDVVQLCDMCDGFLLTGGHDVATTLYGESPSERCGVSCPSRDSLEVVVFRYALSKDKPVLGVCRGIQLINALCGGTLYQDLPTQFASEQNHQMTPPYDQEWHRVDIVEGTPLRDIIGEGEIAVNSYHHQAIKVLSPQLCPTAISKDGLVEGVYMPGRRFVHAVQWHPELNYRVSDSSRKIVASFINAAKQM